MCVCVCVVCAARCQGACGGRGLRGWERRLVGGADLQASQKSNKKRNYWSLPARRQVSAMGAGQLAAGQERVPGLTWRPVSSVDHVLHVLAEGSKNRATAATSLNAHSSRSHALLSVRLTGADGRSSVLHLVDLAGGQARVRGAHVWCAVVRTRAFVCAVALRGRCGGSW